MWIKSSHLLALLYLALLVAFAPASRARFALRNRSRRGDDTAQITLAGGTKMDVQKLAVMLLVICSGCGQMDPGPSSRYSTYPTGAMQDTRDPGDIVRSWDLSYVKELTDFKELESNANKLLTREWDATLGRNSYRQGGRTGPGRKALDERRRQWYIENTPDLNPDTAKLILAGELRVGMSILEAFASWGFPNEVSTTHTVRGRDDQCIYRTYEGSATSLSLIGVYNPAWAYLYFNNYVLTSWQH